MSDRDPFRQLAVKQEPTGVPHEWHRRNPGRSRPGGSQAFRDAYAWPVTSDSVGVTQAPLMVIATAHQPGLKGGNPLVRAL